MMGFLVLLLLAMMALVSVEIQVAGHTTKRARAEQNALLALNIALGELQKTTGPDQRVTSQADLQNPGITANTHWTGVYGHALTPQYDLNPKVIAEEWTDTERVDSQGSAAKLLSWLVSGNSTESSWPVFNASGELADASFEPTLNFRPDASVGNLTSDTLATATDVTIQNTAGEASPARILVGKGSVEEVQDFVVAPLVTLDTGNSDGSTDGYAYWVAEENVKARANLEIETDAADLKNAFTNATRTAIELMAQGSNDDELDAARIDTLYDPYGNVSRANVLDELGLLSSDSATFSQIEKQRYHDISFTSTSLLTDSFAGGLKRDLSTLLSEGYTPPSDDTTANSEPMWTLHPDDSTGYAVPTWKHLRSFAQTRVPASRMVEMRLPSFNKPGHHKVGYPDDVGVAPVLTYFALGLGFSLEGDTITLNLYPLVVLWNPYNFTLKAPPNETIGANLEVGIMFPNAVSMGIDVYDPGTLIDDKGTVDAADDVGTEYQWVNVGAVHLDTSIEHDPGDPEERDIEFIRFGLECPDIPPGQSLVFSIPYNQRGQTYESYPVLKNIEPEWDGYVSVPITQLDSKYGASNIYRVSKFYYTREAIDPDTGEKIDLMIDGKSQNLMPPGPPGGMHTYLGQPTIDRIVYEKQGEARDYSVNPANSNLKWYQVQNTINWDSPIVTEIPEDYTLVDTYKGPMVFHTSTDNVSWAIQNERPLGTESSISYVIMMHALFSGAGNNAQYNGNQFMFPTRWIAQGNMRATRTGRTRRDRNFLPPYIATAGTSGFSSNWLKFNLPDGDDDSRRSSAGSGHDATDDDSPVDASLFEFLPEGQPILSIGQLQHANLSLVGAYPSYPVGNSLADYHLHEKSNSGSILDPEDYQLARTDSTGGNDLLKADMQAYYDISYLLNRNLWDRYFFSSLPESGVIPESLPNPRMAHDGSTDLRDADLAATHLELLGGFNINSTSEQAWRAVLGGVSGLGYVPDEDGGSSSSTSLSASFPRFTRPTSDNSWKEPWQGYRSLSEEQVAQLARNIVTEIKNRGPFVSLGDFVNRRLVDNPDTNDTTLDVSDAPYEYEDLRGALQAAVDRTWDSSGSVPGFPVNDPSDVFWDDDPILGQPIVRKTESQFNANVYDYRRIRGGDVERKPYSNRSAFSPKYVTQADILSTIGSSLTARSDTFTIRAYGEVSSDFSDSDTVGAWCEAVVQRTVDYVDSATNAAEDVPSTAENQTFGRQYKLISFRWLNTDEI